MAFERSSNRRAIEFAFEVAFEISSQLLVRYLVSRMHGVSCLSGAMASSTAIIASQYELAACHILMSAFPVVLCFSQGSVWHSMILRQSKPAASERPYGSMP